MDVKFVPVSTGIRQLNSPAPSSGQVARKLEPSAAGVDPVTSGEETSGSSVAAVKTENEAQEASLDKVVEELNRSIQQTNRALEFTIDERQGRPVVSVVDRDTNKVIRQIPSEVALQVADTLEDVTGVLVSEHA